ncbi:MAG: hypothetical protein IPK20_25665 [Betaproteobacteria bacterium]|nr:hypothetical protein [Betaproteobacteria bacterium]
MPFKNLVSPLIAATVLLGPHASLAGQTFPMTVTAVHKPEKFEQIGKDEKNGRLTFFSLSKAVDRELRGKGLWADSSRTATAYWDMAGGYGTGRGFSRTEKSGGSVLVEWNGVCYPAGEAGGKPVTHCSGGWFVVPGSGSGPFSGLAGGGTWTGTGTADGGFLEEWSGLMEQ